MFEGSTHHFRQSGRWKSHAGLSPSATYRHQQVTRWHTDGSVQPDVTPFSVYTAPRSSDPRFRPTSIARWTITSFRRPPGRRSATPISNGQTSRPWRMGQRLSIRWPHAWISSIIRPTSTFSLGRIPTCIFGKMGRSTCTRRPLSPRTARRFWACSPNGVRSIYPTL